jgi:putative flippase GtrA
MAPHLYRVGVFFVEGTCVSILQTIFARENTVSQKSFGKYLVVRIGSRTVDLATFIAILMAFGQEFFVSAFILSGLLDYLLDFWGQKLWVFRDYSKSINALWKEFARYFGIRLTFGLTLLGIHHSLQVYLGMSLLYATLLLICIFWPIMFFLYRKYVFGTQPSS